MKLKTSPKKLILAAIFFVSGCHENFAEIRLKASEISSKSGFGEQIYQTENFKIYTLQKITDPKKPIRVYFEGDGKAFIRKHLVSANPTPTSYFLVKLLQRDDWPNIIYIARPCQYLEDDKCDPKYWTNARFSNEIIDASNEVLQNFRTQKLELIGYSGGAAIAKHIAVRNKNVLNFRSIAGNLDHETFTKVHHVLPLDESAPDQDLDRLANIPQIHFIGEKDVIIPPNVSQSYLEKLPQKNCVEIFTVKNATHSKGWGERWQELLEMQINCTKNTN